MSEVATESGPGVPEWLRRFFDFGADFKAGQALGEKVGDKLSPFNTILQSATQWLGAVAIALVLVIVGVFILTRSE